MIALVMQLARPSQTCGPATVLLENLRFNAGEETNDEAFARELSSMADVYVNDALAASQSRTRFTSRATRLVQNCGIGHAVKAELAALDRVLEPNCPSLPFWAVCD